MHKEVLRVRGRIPCISAVTVYIPIRTTQYESLFNMGAKEVLVGAEGGPGTLNLIALWLEQHHIDNN